MNCSDVQDVLPEIVDRSENIELEAHLKTCADCSDLVSDLQWIASEARGLADMDEPAQRVWVRIAAELRAEGIIREDAPVALPVAKPAATRRWNAWWLVPVAAGLVTAGAYSIRPKPAATVASTEVTNPSSAGASVSADQPSARAANETGKTAKPPVAASANKTPTVPEDSANQVPMMTVGTSDQELLNGVSPDMRSAYENQLRTVNAYIRDADAYVKQNPADEDARQHLMDAYEQREMLYQMALDHVQ
jgi:hypothetical protein